MLKSQTMNYIQRLSDAMDNEAENVALLSYIPATKLEQKLLLVRGQIEIAAKNELRDALELLKLWEKQITDAVELKRVLNPDENPVLDMNMELPEVMGFELFQKRQEVLKNKLQQAEEIQTGGM